MASFFFISYLSRLTVMGEKGTKHIDLEWTLLLNLFILAGLGGNGRVGG